MLRIGLVVRLPRLVVEMFALCALIITKEENKCIDITLRSKSLVQEETVHLDLTTGKMLNLGVNLLQRACVSLFYHFCPCLLYTRQLLP